jgi:molybdopterin molybdotransferase
MRGFSQRATVDLAIAWIDRASATLPATDCPLSVSAGRVLARPLTAPINVPEFVRSAMDGYAVRSEETTGVGDYNPAEFQVIGESFPGRPADVVVSPGSCVRIMTGAPLPAGADAVVPVENTRKSSRGIEVTEPVPFGKNVGRVGEDITMGEVVLPAWRRLRPQDVAVAASLGFENLSVVQRPRVRILLTGNELVTAGQLRGPYQIYDANSHMLRGLVERDGGEVETVQHLPDSPSQIREALTTPGADVILVSGGSSVGEEDYAPGLVAELGELPIHGIAMRPSSPTGLGRIGETLVLLLPGNPVSCLCAYDFFAGRAIRRLGGRSSAWPYRSSRAPLARKLVSAIGRVDYCRVRLTPEGIEPLALSGASVLSSTTRADGFVVAPEMSEGYGPGTEVTVYWYDEMPVELPAQA